MKDSGEQEKRKVPVIEVDESQLRAHVSEVVHQSVEETLNGLLDAEADALCKARRYERNADRASTRAGYYERGFQTTAGQVRLKVPKLRQVSFETAIIERYRRRESSVEKRLWKCIWPAYPSARLRILPRRSGAAVSVRVPSAT